MAKVQIQLQHVHARAAKKPEGRGLRMRADERKNLVNRQPTRMRNTARLQLRGSRRDVRVEPGAAGGDHLGRHGSRWHVLASVIASRRSRDGLEVISI